MINILDVVSDWLKDSGIISQYKFQKHEWIQESSDKGSFRYAVIRNNGGTDVVFEQGAEYYLLLDLVGAKDGRKELTNTASDIVDYVMQNTTEPCPVSIFNMGGFPTPQFTSDNRMVIRLQLRAVYGQ